MNDLMATNTFLVGIGICHIFKNLNDFCEIPFYILYTKMQDDEPKIILILSEYPIKTVQVHVAYYSAD